MAVKQWAVGDVLSASDMNVWTVPMAVIKPADTGRNTTTTLVNDPDLQLSLAAGAMYDVRAVLAWKGTTTTNSDIQVTIKVPTGSTGFFIFFRHLIATFPAFSGDYADFGTASNGATNGTANLQAGIIEASVTTAGTAGTLAFAWAQNTSNGTNTTVLAGSKLSAQRIG